MGTGRRGQIIYSQGTGMMKNSSRRMCMVTVKYRVVGSIAVEGTGSLRRQGDKSRRGQKRGKKIGEGGVMEAEGGGELQKVG